MRDILFRGKNNDGDWVYGYINQHRGDSILDCKCEQINSGDYYIYDYSAKVDTGIYGLLYKIAPETQGQFTGLTDKNGVKVFEGDIIKTHYANTPNSDYIEKVAFDAGRFCSNYDSGSVSWRSALYDGVPHLKQDKTVYMDSLEVIGNIHDNIELLKRKES